MKDCSTFIAELTTQPGVYIMYDVNDKVIYVGKAKNLKKRVASYFLKNITSAKTQALIAKIERVEVTITSNENAALLLEANLIKQYRPRYNVLMRDDKSYPYLLLSAHCKFPRLDFHRGTQRQQGNYFGPFPNAGAVRDNLNLIQKLFKIRQCSDSFFSNRSRPCLQYQIARCTAPCVGYVNEQEYGQQIRHVKLFLQGKCDAIIADLTDEMRIAALREKFEIAAMLRNRIQTLREMQQQQAVVSNGGNVDVFAIDLQQQHFAVSVLSVRAGRVLGQRVFYPMVKAADSLADALMEFIPQYYLNPVHQQISLDRIVTSVRLGNKAWLESSLQELLPGKPKIVNPNHSKYQYWSSMALENARQALLQRLAGQAVYVNKWDSLQQALQLENAIERIECFDISHTQGEATVASCVVFGPGGPLNHLYRRFNIKNITPGDDYAAMHQALMRCYAKQKEEAAVLPDLIIIDGGKGQLAQAVNVLEALQLSGVLLLGIAKGPTRKAGSETLFIAGRKDHLALSAESPAMYLLQMIRDEAHRFAITAHRKQRSTNRLRSKLEGIPGIGKKRRQALLTHFGGMQALIKASVADIEKVGAISKVLAQAIFDHLHKEVS